MPYYQGPKEIQNFNNLFSEVSLMDEEVFKKELSELKRFDNKDIPDSILHLKAGILYSHFRNPAPDYERALKEFESYINLEPHASNDHLLLKWINFVRKIEDLKKESVRLKKENKDLNDKIEQIKSLDIKMEKRRQKTR